MHVCAGTCSSSHVQRGPAPVIQLVHISTALNQTPANDKVPTVTSHHMSNGLQNMLFEGGLG